MNVLITANPSIKLMVSICLFIFALFIRHLETMICLSLILCLFFWLSTTYTWKIKLVWLAPFILVFLSTSSAMIFFGKGTNELWSFGLIRITTESLQRGLLIGTRSLVFGLIGLLFSCTTNSVMLAYSLMQQLKVSPKYAYAFLAAIRLVPLMVDEFRVRRQALKVRGFYRKKNSALKYHELMQLAIPLLAQSIRRAYRVGLAMVAKQFDEHKSRTFFYEMTLGRTDIYYFFVMTSVVLLSIFIGRWMS